MCFPFSPGTVFFFCRILPNLGFCPNGGLRGVWPFSGGSEDLAGGAQKRVDRRGLSPNPFAFMDLLEISPESTKDCNRKSPRFSVANVPVASQTAVGTLFFPEKSQKELQSLATFRCKKFARVSGGGEKKHFWGPKHRCDCFPTSVNRNRNRREPRGPCD